MAARVHIVVCTHTTRHLDACLRGLARQTRPPASIVVSCDTDDPEIGGVVRRAAWPAGVQRVGWIGRAFAGIARLNQVRNNALRALDPFLSDRDLIVVIDGDIVLEPTAIAKHAALAEFGAGMVHAFRINLDETATAALTAALGAMEHLADIEPFISESARSALAHRARRLRRHALLRQLGLQWTGHKPKLLGAHHAIRVGLLREINGYDEAYEGYGFDDDDLARRLHATGARGVIAVEEIIALHLHHPSRAPARATDAPGFARFKRRDLPTRAERGWMSPMDQAPVRMEWMVRPAGTDRP